MEQWHGRAARVERVTAGARTYELLVPADCEALLTDPQVEARFARDEYMPYWATLWPGALLLADVVAAWDRPPAGNEPPTVLELGCGLGLVGLVALDRGWCVIMSDYDEEALAFAAENARRNALPVPVTRYIDWRQAYPDLGVDRIVAGDVLYEARNLEPVAEFIRRHLRPDGFALVSDANRSTADPFARVAGEHGLSVTVTPAQRLAAPGGVPISGRIYHVRRR
jgi:predicted nicotinamide N-methyase